MSVGEARRLSIVTTEKASKTKVVACLCVHACVYYYHFYNLSLQMANEKALRDDANTAHWL